MKNWWIRISSYLRVALLLNSFTSIRICFKVTSLIIFTNDNRFYNKMEICGKIATPLLINAGKPLVMCWCELWSCTNHFFIEHILIFWKFLVISRIHLASSVEIYFYLLIRSPPVSSFMKGILNWAEHNKSNSFVQRHTFLARSWNIRGQNKSHSFMNFFEFHT